MSFIYKNNTASKLQISTEELSRRQENRAVEPALLLVRSETAFQLTGKAPG